MSSIERADFDKVDIRVGKIVDVLDFPEARNPSYRLLIDFGKELGVKQSSAQITELPKHLLLGTLVACVVNFPPKRIAHFTSEVLTLGFPNDEGKWVVVSPILDVPLGGRLQ